MNEKISNIDESPYRRIGKEFSGEAEYPGEEIQTDLANPGDTLSFTAIYNRLYPFSFFFARKFLSREDAADIVSAVFTRLWDQKKKFANLTHAKAFLRVTVKNACLDHFRKESCRIRKENGWHYSEYGQEKGEEFLKEEIGAEKLARIHAAIEELSPRCRKVFKMAYLNNQKNNEIAELLGISVLTVKKQKSHALKVLRMALLEISIFISFIHSFHWY